MRSRILLSSVLAASLMSGCGKSFEVASQTVTLPAIDGTTDSQGNQEQQTFSSKIVSDVETGLREKQTGVVLSESEIKSLVQAALDALKAKGLSGSTDLKSILPVIMQAMTQATGGLQLGGAVPDLSDLLATISSRLIDSVKNRTGGGVQAELLESIMKSLFQNLTSTGASPANLSQISGDIMNLLVAHLGKMGLQSGPLATLLQSLASGAASGAGQLNLGDLKATILQEIMNRIGLGSTQGLSGITNSTDILKVLMEAITKGSKSGLGQVLGQSPLGMTLNQLLTSLISGQNSGLGNMPMESVKKQVLSAFLQLLLSKI